MSDPTPSATTNRVPSPVMIVVVQLRRKVPGGIGTAAAGLLSGLAALPDPVRSGLVLYASAPSGVSARKPEADPLWQYDLPMLASPLPPALLTRLWERGRAKPRRSLSLLHATSFQYPRVTAPVTVTIHDLGWRHIPDAYGAHGRRWHEAALGRADHDAAGFVVPSQPVADDLAASGIALGGRPIEVVPWGADHLPRPDDVAADATLATLGVDRPFLLTVSTIEPRKNLARLIAAYGEARRALDDPPLLLVVGPEGWGDGLRGGEGVVLAGHVAGPVLSAIYARALAFAYVPLHEGFGLPVREAMHAGKAVVASAVPSSGDATLTVDPHDLGSIRDGLVTIVRDEPLRDQLARAGQALAATDTWAECARRHLALWRALGAELPL